MKAKVTPRLGHPGAMVNAKQSLSLRLNLSLKETLSDYNCIKLI